jgi:hypothetical protein
MVAVAAVAVMGMGSAGPLDAITNTSAGKVLQNATLNGAATRSCGGAAPVVTACGFPLDDPSVCDISCAPRISGTLGYTGTVWAFLDGFNADHSPASAWRECSLAAGQAVKAGGAELTYCHDGSNARESCGADCVVLYPPYSLRGAATPPKVAGTQAGPTEAGTWNVYVVYS